MPESSELQIARLHQAIDEMMTTSFAVVEKAVDLINDARVDGGRLEFARLLSHHLDARMRAREAVSLTTPEGPAGAVPVRVVLHCEVGYKTDQLNRIGARLYGPYGSRRVGHTLVRLWNAWWDAVDPHHKEDPLHRDSKLQTGWDDDILARGAESCGLGDVADALGQVLPWPVEFIDGPRPAPEEGGG